MDSAGCEDQRSVEDLEKTLENRLFSAFSTIHALQLDISMYLLHHNAQGVRRNPLSGNMLDDIYIAYEERANDCRRLWMKVRAMPEQRASTMGVAGSSLSGSRSDLETSPSPLEHRSALGEDELAGAQKNDQVTPMDVDLPRLPKPAADPHPPKPTTKVCPRSFRIKLLLSFFIPER